MKYEYAIRRASLSPSGITFSNSNQTMVELMNEMGRRGFKYIGYHPAGVIGFGRVSSINLVFERCRED